MNISSNSKSSGSHGATMFAQTHGDSKNEDSDMPGRVVFEGPLAHS